MWKTSENLSWQVMRKVCGVAAQASLATQAQPSFRGWVSILDSICLITSSLLWFRNRVYISAKLSSDLICINFSYTVL